jgi:hypothetical protein
VARDDGIDRALDCVCDHRHARSSAIVSAGALALCGAAYFLRMFGITAGYHRYFAHRAYKTSRVFQFVLAWLGCSALQKGPLWWAAHHRRHHRHSDRGKTIPGTSEDLVVGARPVLAERQGHVHSLPQLGRLQ